MHTLTNIHIGEVFLNIESGLRIVN